MLRTGAHTLMLLAALKLTSLVATGVPARLLAPVSHADFLTMATAAAVALNRDRIIGGALLIALLFDQPARPVEIGLALGAGLLLGTLLRTLLRTLVGARHGQPVSDATAGAGLRAAYRDDRRHWCTSDPFGLDRTHHSHTGRPARDGGDDDAAPDGRGRPAH